MPAAPVVVAAAAAERGFDSFADEASVAAGVAVAAAVKQVIL